MKKLILFCGIIWVSLVQSMAQSDEGRYETITAGGWSVSGFGGPLIIVSEFDGGTGVMVGGEGGLLLDQKFYFGGYGFGMSNSVDASRYEVTEWDYREGGLMTGWIFRPNRAIHTGISLRAGWGGVSFADNENVEFDTFALTPGMEVEANITSFFRISLGMQYHFMVDMEVPEGYRQDDFSGLGGILRFKFGSFSH